MFTNILGGVESKKFEQLLIHYNLLLLGYQIIPWRIISYFFLWVLININIWIKIEIQNIEWIKYGHKQNRYIFSFFARIDSILYYFYIKYKCVKLNLRKSFATASKMEALHATALMISQDALKSPYITLYVTFLKFKSTLMHSALFTVNTYSNL